MTNNFSQQSSSQFDSNYAVSYAKENAVIEDYKLHDRHRSARPALTIPPSENHQANSTIKKKLPPTHAKDSLMDLATLILQHNTTLNNIDNSNTNIMQETQHSQPPAQHVFSYYHSPPDEKYAQPSNDNIPQQPITQQKHARSLSKEFSKAYGQTRGQLTPAVIHIPRRPKAEAIAPSFPLQDAPLAANSAITPKDYGDYDGTLIVNCSICLEYVMLTMMGTIVVNNSRLNIDGKSISPRRPSSHKVPPLGYKDRSIVLESTKNAPKSVGINAINRPQSSSVDNIVHDDVSDNTSIDSDDDNDEEDSSDVDEQSPESDAWLKNWKHDDPEICCICLDTGTDEDNAFVYCDNPQCEVIVHQECYAISVAPGLEDVWLCDRCQAQKDNPSEVVACAICPNKHGAFRRLDPSHKIPGWIHVVCGTWMPNVHIADQKNITGFNIREIPERNWKSKCYLCPDQISASFGACVNCDAGACKKTFHVSCAQKFSLLEDEEEEQNMANPYFTYCIEHSSYNQGQARLNAWEKWVRQRDRYLMSKNEAAAERRCARLWKKAHKLNKPNSDAISELIRTGFGFRELISDRYATFANEMANAISATQSNVFQLESENHQMESTISKLDASLNDTEKKIKRAEKQKAELQEELKAGLAKGVSGSTNARRTAKANQSTNDGNSDRRGSSRRKVNTPVSASTSKPIVEKHLKSESTQGLHEISTKVNGRDQTPQEESSSPVANKHKEEKIFAAARNALRNGKRLMERAQNISIMTSRRASITTLPEAYEALPEQVSSYIAENDITTPSQPRHKSHPPPTSIPITKAVNQHPIATRKSSSSISASKAKAMYQHLPTRRKSASSKLSVQGRSAAQRSTEEPVPQYFRLSPFGPEKELKQPMESIQWLSKLDMNDDVGLTGQGKEIVTEYIPVVDSDESVSPEKEPQNKRTASHMEATNHKENARKKSSLPVQATQPNAVHARTSKRKLQLEPVQYPLPTRKRPKTPLNGQRVIKDESEVDESPIIRRTTRTASVPVSSSSPKPRERRDDIAKESRKSAVTNGTGSQHSNEGQSQNDTEPAASTQGKVNNTTTRICTTCRRKDIPQNVIDALGISPEDMKHLEKIRPFAKPGRTGAGKDWDPNALIPCETCTRHYHSGCLDPPLKAYPAPGVSFRCARCDIVKDINAEPVISRAELRKQPKQLRERPTINYHE
ncbi:hypothetical protein INT43_005985 [Umbelopsis isabellina]|uniref:Uncharacterized protein n=1 Tax=Mortierella isabellina TaxID=91625 RepID=A0A8H7UCK0_MORIS|nr:hypothetical protein INT43_005985 [Umbelopsis isabellina]